MPGSSYITCNISVSKSIMKYLMIIRGRIKGRLITVLMFLFFLCLAGFFFVPRDVLQCKKMVFEYAPVILVNAEHFLEKNDVCAILHACEPAVGKEEVLPKLQTSMHSAS